MNRARKRLVPSLELNALALMAATGITALLGFGFWGVAAQLPAAEVGRASAIITTATTLSQLSASNIGILFGRVMSSAGGRVRRVVLAGYGAGAAIALVLSTGFVLLFPHEELFRTPLERWTFPLLVVLFVLFALQDWVFIGMRSSGWVPLEQLLFAAGKIGLLAWFVGMSYTQGIVIAWALPILVLVLVINPVLLFKVLPNRPAAPEGATPMPTWPELRKIFAAEYATGAATVAIPMVLPLLVVAMLGTEANAYYAIPWLIGESFGVLMWNISSSYVVEASHDRRQQVALMKRSLRLSFLITLVGVPALVFIGPWLLSVINPTYAAEGTTVLRLMVLAVPFAIITMMFTNTARVQNRMSRAFALEASLAVVVIGAASFLLPRMGIDGAGWAYFGAQALGALVVSASLIRFMRTARDEPPAPVPVLPSEPLPVPPTSYAQATAPPATAPVRTVPPEEPTAPVPRVQGLDGPTMAMKVSTGSSRKDQR